MIRRDVRGRAGITLTEILISIMIMGIGLVSLATLFPLGLLRLRAAAIKSRSAFLVESAEAEMATRNLLSRSSFITLPTSTWYTAGTVYDPWIQDTPQYGAAWTNGVYRGLGGSGLTGNTQTTPIDGPGLPVAYDPLWRATTGVYPGDTRSEARFASGLATLRAAPKGGGSPGAHGLQRITNLHPLSFIVDTSVSNPTQYALDYNQIFLPKVASIFVSPDDIVFQTSTQTTAGATAAVGSSSPLVPDMSGGSMVNDWMYTWMFTGRRSQATNATVYDGDIVILHGRPLALDGGVAAGEPVVEAIFGYSTRVTGRGNRGTVDYAQGGDRVVLLRWPATVADPEVRVGSWIADVTYERVAAVDAALQAITRDEGTNRATGLLYVPPYPYQRCHWYQVVKKSDVQVADAYTGDGGTYRSMTVVVHTPVRARTLMDPQSTPIQPYHVNAALISRYVVNVFPKSFTTR